MTIDYKERKGAVNGAGRSPRIPSLGFRFCIVALLTIGGHCLASGHPSVAGGESKPGNIRVGAYEPGSWNGVTFILDDAAAFQVRVGVAAEFGDLLDGDSRVGHRLLPHPQNRRSWQTFWRDQPFFYAVTDLGPKAPDSSYCRVGWNPLYPYDTGSRIRFEWSRIDEATVLAKITYDAPPGQIDYNTDSRVADIVLEAYSPWRFSAEYSIRDGRLTAVSRYRAAIGEIEWNGWRFAHSTSNAELASDQEPGLMQGYHKHEFDDRRWPVVLWNSYWQENPGIDKSGYGWYRHSLILPKEWRDREISLDLGSVTEEDRTFINGVEIGSGKEPGKRRIYKLRSSDAAYRRLNWGGANVVAIQVKSRGNVGGMSSGAMRVGWKSNPGARPRISALEDEPREANFGVLASQMPASTGTYDRLDELQQQFQRTGRLGGDHGKQYAGLHYGEIRLAAKNKPANQSLYFVAGINRDAEHLNQHLRRVLSASREQLDARLAGAARHYEQSRVRSKGAYAEAAAMVTNTLHWAEVYGPEQRRSFVVDARRWFSPDRWGLFANSAVLGASAASLENQLLAQETLKGVLAERFPDGRVPNAGSPGGISIDRSEDMYAAYAAWRIYQKWGDRDFLRTVYVPIKQWHEWWFADRGDGQPFRDGNRNGLLELGSDTFPHGAPQPPRDSEEYGLHHQGAMWESGYDDNPSWGSYTNGPAVHPPTYPGEPGVDFVFRTGTLNLDTVLTNSLWALSADMLLRMARELSLDQDADRFAREHREISSRINSRLWDESRGLYADRLWDEAGGRFSSRKTPMMFYLMSAGVATPAQARRLVEEHLLNPKEFWGEFVLPTVSRDDPTYAEQYYWRGTIWPPMNYFTYQGLKRYGYDREAAELVRRTFKMVKLNWDRDGGLYENYLSINGLGNPWKGQTTIHYSWSAAFPTLALMEMIDQEPWGGLRFGSLSRDGAAIENLEMGGHKFEVKVGSETAMSRDGVNCFSASGPVIVRDWESSGDLRFRLKSDRAGIIVAIPVPVIGGAKRARLEIDGRPVAQLSAVSGGFRFASRSGEHQYCLKPVK